MSDTLSHLKRFDSLFPACGSENSAIELTGDELFNYSFAKQWVDVCKGWHEEEMEEAVAMNDEKD
ncbi:hypothetical protein AOX59_16380 [Lentibacillus amyloliquefaciens]|uniref:Uncharacterized protein n=1 Tax=Lentibacillus amyloliquefaciens TaxID=1472767 RepID=A0A0U4EAQ2_9BACI|nr:hypothetical protein AOX59_16380 [Lentibacillus amyloliquefaciens]